LMIDHSSPGVRLRIDVPEELNPRTEILTAQIGSGIIAAARAQNEILGRGQVARHRVLVPGSQVRILPPQPVGEAIRRSP
jgi:hypothetical protein